jgi:hypothetical protein
VASNQLTDRVRLENVVQDFVGIDQVIDGDEIEAHAELIPEQPFCHRHKERDEQGQEEYALEKPLVPAAAPDRGRAQKQVETQRQRRVGQKGEIIQQANGEQRPWLVTGFIQVGEKNDGAR